MHMLLLLLGMAHTTCMYPPLSLLVSGLSLNSPSPLQPRDTLHASNNSSGRAMDFHACSSITPGHQLPAYVYPATLSQPAWSLPHSPSPPAPSPVMVSGGASMYMGCLCGVLGQCMVDMGSPLIPPLHVYCRPASSLHVHASMHMDVGPADPAASVLKAAVQ